MGEGELQKAGRIHLKRMVRAAALVAAALAFSWLSVPEGTVAGDLARTLGVTAGTAWAQPAAGECDNCTASVMNEITASFATQGYWIQANLINNLGKTDLGLWAPILYVFAVFSGLLMMAMGQPPKIYLWFVLGPAIYNWTLFTPAEGGRKGVNWMVGNTQQDQQMVWRLSEVGLLNNAGTLDNGVLGQDRVSVSASEQPGGDANVALLFVWFDDVISEQMRWITEWAGITRQMQNDTAGGDTNIPTKPDEASAQGSSISGGDDRAWHILSNSKWPMLENVTSATMHNLDLRESYVQFFASECGDVIAEAIRKQAFTAAAHARGSKMPYTVIGKSQDHAAAVGLTHADVKSLIKKLKLQIIPTPIAFRALLEDKEDGSFSKFSPALDIADPGELEFIDCNYYLWALIQGARWESGIIYNQVVAEAAASELRADTIVYDFLYGWRFEDADGRELADPLTIPEQRMFIQNLILIHLLKNELALMPSPANPRYSSAERSENYTLAYARAVGSKSKYGELYTWAKLMPFMQGVLLFILSAAYPFICIVMIIPGWWKAMFSWMGFFAWAKSWDAGFAIVMSLERAIWATLGNGEDMSRINWRVNEMYHLGDLEITDGEPAAKCADQYDLYGCLIPYVTHEGAGNQNMVDAIRTLDMALLLGPALDIDLANAYYIYIMSALYFAVPAVTGQVLLGAKAGAASMVSTAVGGSAQETGRAAGQGHVGQVATDAHNTSAGVSQAAFAKSLRKPGANLAFASLDAGNKGLQSRLAGSKASAAGAMSEFVGMAGSIWSSDFNAARSVGSAAFQHSRKEQWFGNKGQRQGGGGGRGGGAGGRGGGTGTGPGGPGIGGGSTPGSAPGPGGRYLRGLSSSMGVAVPAIDAAGGLYATRRYNQIQAAALKGRAKGSQSGFYKSALAEGYNMEAGRMQARAQQTAGEDQWRAMRNLSSQYAGHTAALGVFAGAFQAGPKPVHMDGMASLGMLNTYEAQAGGRRGGVKRTAGQVMANGDAKGEFFYSGANYRADAQAANTALDGLFNEISRIYPGHTSARASWGKAAGYLGKHVGEYSHGTPAASPGNPVNRTAFADALR